MIYICSEVQIMRNAGYRVAIHDMWICLTLIDLPFVRKKITLHLRSTEFLCRSQCCVYLLDLAAWTEYWQRVDFIVQISDILHEHLRDSTLFIPCFI